MSQASVAHSSTISHLHHRHPRDYRPPQDPFTTTRLPEPHAPILGKYAQPSLPLPHSVAAPPPPPPPPMMASRPSAPSSSTGRAKRKPNWEEFYKNGPPKEIIMIHDTPPPSDQSKPPESSQSLNGRRTMASSSSHRNVPQTSSRTMNPHGEKRIRTGLDDYATNSTPSTSVSRRSRTPNGYYSSQTRVSTQSRNGINPTPSSSISTGVSVGTKRKRITRSTAAASIASVQGGTIAQYWPPQRPITKSKEVHVEQIHEPSGPNDPPVDDEDGHYIVQAGADLTRRYRINKLLGQGTFGKVVEAYDRDKRQNCAIKVIRSVQKYRDASRIELRVLQTLYNHDRLNRNKCIHLRHCFDFKNHICIVTDLLGMSVFDFLKSNNFAPFPNSHIQSFAKQLLISVTFLHDLNLIHTDLKPENILLVHNSSHTFAYQKKVPSSSTTTSRTLTSRRVLYDTEIRLIDFGSATFEDEYHSSVVSTRHYRAPEIIMGLGWSFPCDIWSIGCILVEFFTGDALFQTHDNLEHLAMMQEVVGSKIDQKLVRSLNAKTGNTAQQAQRMFRNLKLDYPTNDTPRSSRKYVQCMKRLDEIIPPISNFNKQFLDLLKKIFVYDPAKRITAKEAMRHPWFKEITVDDGTEAAQIRVDREARANTGQIYSSPGYP